MPPPEWLVENVIPEGGLVGLYAPPESLKSFVSIDLSLCVATGLPWHGHQVQKGFVVYISAEGGGGIGKRILAWLVEHGSEAHNADIAWIIESVSVNADSGEIATLLDRLTNELRRDPVLIVIDTLARCFDGDENQQEDMGRFIAGVDLLRRQFNCAVLIVHHTRLDGERERGNTAFRGAADTMIQLSRTDDFVELKCAKQKDAEHFETLDLEKIVIEGTDSCVVRQYAPAQARQEKLDQFTTVLKDAGPSKWDDWVDACEQAGLPKNQFFKYIQALKKSGQVQKNKKGLWEVNS